MVFGILLKGVNSLNEGSAVNFFFEFIPQLFFLVLSFGYMVFLIFYKWSIEWAELGTNTAPSLINMMINLVL